MLAASHLNGSRVYVEKNSIYMEIPETILHEDEINFFENGRSTAISKSTFFSCYVGVATTIVGARKNLKEVLKRVLAEFANNNTFFEYLKTELSFDVIQMIPPLPTKGCSIAFREKSQWTPHGI